MRKIEIRSGETIHNRELTVKSLIVRNTDLKNKDTNTDTNLATTIYYLTLRVRFSAFLPRWLNKVREIRLSRFQQDFQLSQQIADTPNSQSPIDNIK
ncbi:hypothetical protein X777_07576 [Ooceraea biroi]|uniref:Uncharacterized protein n=1 Tax=Ooceraea biroi TaxID=2015173 RepID=A0A026X394_OOCBI|nr:hypothetical protein X777_07576 [Ooceraea biroi]